MTTVSNVLVRGLRRGVLMCAFPAALLCAAGAAAADFNDPGNIVIADQVNNPVIEIDLNTPVHALVTTAFPGHPGPHVLITDQANSRVILVNLRRQIVWQYGMTLVPGAGANQLNNPNSAELLANGHVLIADENNNRVIEVTTARQLVRQFTARGTVSGAAFASRLRNGNTLITDANNNRIVEVNAADAPVWEYLTNTESGSNSAPLPTRAVRLANGNTLISDQFNQRVIEVTPAKDIVFTQGLLNTPGNGFNRLNGPYDAKVVGDFTGLTPPLGGQ